MRLCRQLRPPAREAGAALAGVDFSPVAVDQAADRVVVRAIAR